MAKTLVLAEKPSVGKEIARVLGCKRGQNGYIEGDKYIVTWGLGHLVTLADPELYNEKYKKWDMADLPMLPDKMKLVTIRETSKQFKTVQALMKRNDISSLVIATDAGREGELVARWIMMKAGFNKPAKRLWISSQTDKAIREGFNSLRPSKEYDDLFKSAEARSHADWLVGLNVTRALTCKFGAQLSAGRVQTPTLALIVDREKEINAFRPKDYYTVSVKADGFSAIWKGKNGSRIFDKSAAEAIAQKVKNGQGVLTGVTRTYKHKAPPALYDLTELQRDANRKYAYSAKETLQIMQSLYEYHKVLTYPRTDSRYISDDIVPTLQERLRSVCVGEYTELARSIMRNRPLQTKYIVNNAKVTDHHAIIPTEEQVMLHKLSGPEKNIYDLVVRRFMAALLPAFEYEETSLTLTVNKESFYAKGKIVKNAGWKAAYGKSIIDDDNDDEDIKEQSLPAVSQGQRIKILDSRLQSGKTSPPKRYTEATLLSAMENPTGQVQDRELSKVLSETSGLGTPATRADIIEKLFSTFYIERRGKELVPTSKGIQLVKIVPQELRSAALTAQWEQKLQQIAQGKYRADVFVKDMKKYASELVTQVKNSTAEYVHDNMTREKCPDCGKYLLDVKGKKGRMLVCSDRECGYRKTVETETNARCPNCHKKLTLRGEGEKKMFCCICGYRERLSDFEKRRQERGANKNDVRRYMQNQSRNEEKGMSALAAQLAMWQENKK